MTHQYLGHTSLMPPAGLLQARRKQSRTSKTAKDVVKASQNLIHVQQFAMFCVSLQSISTPAD